MKNNLKPIYIHKDTHLKLKKRAIDKGCKMYELADQILMAELEKEDDFSFFDVEDFEEEEQMTLFELIEQIKKDENCIY